MSDEMTEVTLQFAIGLASFALAVLAYLLKIYIPAMMFAFLVGQMTGILGEQ